RHAQAGGSQGQGGIQQAQADVADVGRGCGRAQLPGLGAWRALEEAHTAPKVSKGLKAAQDVLDADHYGLERVKERILEYLAVQTRVQKMKGAILCLVGPPGVGKTSLGQSIAKATNRK